MLINKDLSKEVTAVESLKKYLQKNKITQKKYCLEILAKKDWLTNNPIEFKSLEQYLLSDFNNKNNLKKWLQLQNKLDALNYITSKLKQYLDTKELQCAPSHNFLKTLSCLPIIKTFEFFAQKPFHLFCQDIGIKCQFKYGAAPNPTKEIKQIIIDTREQNPIKYEELQSSVECLKYADYSETQTSKIRCERKSGSDYKNSISKNLDRLKREMGRAAQDGAYIVIVVESSLNNTIYAKSRFGYATPPYLEHQTRDLLKSCENCQILFCEGRKEAKRCIKKILSIGDDVKNYDLQFYYDERQF